MCSLLGSLPVNRPKFPLLNRHRSPLDVLRCSPLKSPRDNRLVSHLEGRLLSRLLDRAVCPQRNLVDVLQGNLPRVQVGNRLANLQVVLADSLQFTRVRCRAFSRAVDLVHNLLANHRLGRVGNQALAHR